MKTEALRKCKKASLWRLVGCLKLSRKAPHRSSASLRVITQQPGWIRHAYHE